MDNFQIAVIGAGSMGGAILSGLLKSGINPFNIRVSTKTKASAANLTETYKVSAHSSEEHPDANLTAANGAGIVILAVKPAQIIEVLEQIGSSLKANALVISVAAGITTKSMEEILHDQVAVIRAMPNTPAIFGLGVTGVSKGERASEAQLEVAKKLFETIGQVLIVPEGSINALSTISGSGPAYVFYFAEKLIEAAKAMGFSDSEAELMVKGTFLGSAKLLSESAETPQELRRQVTSPNGTTMQAIARFDEAELEKIFQEATTAALKRAIELGERK